MYSHFDRWYKHWFILLLQPTAAIIWKHYIASISKKLYASKHIFRLDRGVGGEGNDYTSRCMYCNNTMTYEGHW